jgi:hypothetical protein
VLVAGDQARVRRIDRGGDKVYAIEARNPACASVQPTRLRAPLVVATEPTLAFGPSGGAPGAEIWLREGVESAAVELAPRGTGAATAWVLHVKRHAGATAIDGRGDRWVRVGRVPLPAWAADGVVAKGTDNVALRAVVRVPRVAAPAESSSARAPAEPVSEQEIADDSRAILGASGPARGEAHLRRALALARAGYARAAMIDARAAEALGAKAESDSPVFAVRAAVRRRTTQPVSALSRPFGLDPDFDPHHARCDPSEPPGPRAQLHTLDRELRALGDDPAWSSARAIEANDVVVRIPEDPLATSVQTRSLIGSRWKRIEDPSIRLPRVARPRPPPHHAVVDADGALSPRLATGDPFAGAGFVSLAPGRRARATIARKALDAHARLDVVCVTRAPSEAGASSCPLDVDLGGVRLPLTLDASGASSVELPASVRGKDAELTLQMRPGPGRWAAVARIAFDREVPESRFVDKVGWVLEPPRTTLRYLAASGTSTALRVAGPTLLRIDAVAEPGEKASIVATVEGKRETLAADGSPHLFSVHGPSTVSIAVQGGAATLRFAERTAIASSEAESDDTEDESEGSEPGASPDAAAGQPAPAAIGRARANVLPVLDLDADSRAQGWRDVARASAEPLSPLQASLGTLVASTTVAYGTLHLGSLDTDPDGYVEESLGYRRRIESTNLTVLLSGTARERAGDPTGGAGAVLYEDLDALRLRISGTALGYTQQIEGQQIATLQARGFVEYSARLASTLFVLPRLGYDGYYSNIPHAPASTGHVDDDVYDPFRYSQPTLAFAQVLVWYVPFFNDIFYVRGRATMNAEAGRLSHTAVRPGFLSVFGDLEVDGYADGTYYAPDPRTHSSSSFETTLSGTVAYNAPLVMGSMMLVPGVTYTQVVTGGGWQALASATFIANYRRGLRDFSSLELNFPEQESMGVPWRGPHEAFR